MAKAKVSNILVWGLLGLLIVSLLGFGVTNFGGSVRSVATVGDVEIETDRYALELQQELRAAGTQTGRAVSLAEARQFGLDQRVLSRLVSQAALENEAGRLGLSVSDEVVGEQILSIPAFRGAGGDFNEETYRFTLENSGLSVAEFEDRVRVDTANTLLASGVTGAVAVPDVYVDTVLAFVLEQRDITWARLGRADLTADIPDPTDAQLEAFLDENAARFTIGETRVITYAWLTPDMIRDTVEIDRAALEERYAERIDEFVVPERRLVERLVFTTEADASDARTAIEAGETSFDALVAERGLTLDDVDLGDVSADDLGDAGAAIFALSEPGIVGPLPTDLGPALFRMNAILNGREVTLEEAEEDLRAELAADRAARVIDAGIEGIDDLLAGGATLEELAAETEMELGRIEWRPGVDEAIAAYDGFRSAAADLAEGDFPEIATLEDGGIFAMRLDEMRPPALPPLSEIRQEVAAAWQARRATEALAAQAATLAAEIDAGREMAGLDLPLETDRGLTRDGFIDGTPPQMLNAVFQMAPDEVRVIEGNAEAFLVRLDAITPPDLDDPETAALRNAVRQQAQQSLSDDLLVAYTNALLTTAGVSVNQSAINAVHAQFP